MTRRFVFAVVVSLVVVACGNEKAKIATAQASACTIRAAATMDMVESNKCSTVADLARSRKLSSDAPDPWGSTYTINCTEDDIRVSSNGPDKAAGTADDVLANTTTCKKL